MRIVNGNETSIKPIQIYDFIKIPNWNVEGCVMDKKPVTYGSEDAQDVLVEEYPGHDGTWFHLEPEHFEIVL